MSFQKATHNDQTLTSLVITGGKDCIPNRLLRAQGPDMWVKGGAIIEKTLCVLGNLYVDGFIIGNICGDVYTEHIISKNLHKPIEVIGNLLIDPDFHLIGAIQTNCISDITGNNVEAINIKTDLDLHFNDIGNVGNLGVDTVSTKDLFVSNTATIQELYVSGGATIHEDLLVEGTLCVAQESFFKGDAFFSGNITGLTRLWQATAGNTGQIIESGIVGNIISFNQESPHNILPPGVWNGSTDFTISSNGWYHLEAAVDLGDMINNKFGLDFLIDGAEMGNICIGDSRLHSTGLPARMHLDCTSYLIEKSNVSVRVRQTTGNPQPLESACLTIEKKS